MSEADLTEQMLALIELTSLSASLSFTVISAYVAGLYWFLRHAGLIMKSIGFLALTLTLALLGVSAFGLVRHAEGVNRALIDLKSREGLSPLGDMASEAVALSITPLLATIASAVGALVFFGLFFLTFFYRWPGSATANNPAHH